MSALHTHLDEKVAQQRKRDDTDMLAAGYNPANHPKWATVGWLETVKASERGIHQRSLSQWVKP